MFRDSSLGQTNSWPLIRWKSTFLILWHLWWAPQPLPFWRRIRPDYCPLHPHVGLQQVLHQTVCMTNTNTTKSLYRKYREISPMHIVAATGLLYLKARSIAHSISRMLWKYCIDFSQCFLLLLIILVLTQYMNFTLKVYFILAIQLFQMSWCLINHFTVKNYLPQQWWDRCCSGWEPQVLLQAPSAPQPFLLPSPGSMFMQVDAFSHTVNLQSKFVTTLTCLKTAVWTIPPATIVPFSRATLKAMSQLAWELGCLVYSDQQTQPWEKSAPGWSVGMWGCNLQAPRHPASNRWMSVWCLPPLLQTWL